MIDKVRKLGVAGGAAALLVLIYLLRIALIGSPDLTDPSESRFANAAVQMERTGDWITPRIYDSHGDWAPYLAKPPFQIWMTALSFNLFEPSAGAARVPAAIAILITMGCMALFTRNAFPGSTVLSLLLFLSFPSIFLFGFASITDPLLMMAITGALVSLFLFSGSGERRWGYAAALFISIGVLTKGPIGAALPILTFGGWMLIEKGRGPTTSYPWIGSILLFSAVVTPWYLLAEQRNPGFLGYFFLRENLGRYLLHDFGNLYGSTHKRPPGTIWLFLAAALLPWSIGAPALISARLRSAVAALWSGNRSIRFLVCWLLTPAVFFTITPQVLVTYVLPALPAGAILIAVGARKFGLLQRLYPASVLLLGCLVSALVLGAPAVSAIASSRTIAEYLRQDAERGAPICREVSVLYKIPQSLIFYGRDLPIVLKKIETQEELLHDDAPCVLVPFDNFRDRFSPEERENFEVRAAFARLLLLRRR